MLHRVQLADTSQHQLFKGDCVNQAFMLEEATTEEEPEERGLLGQRNTRNGPVEICTLV